MSRRQSIFARLIFFLYLVAVAVLCFGHFDSIPSISPTILGIPTDKLVHFLMFFPFPVLAFFAFDRVTESIRTSIIFVRTTFAAGCLRALGTELGQAHLTTYRTGDPMDFSADVIALFVSSVMVFIIDVSKQKRHAQKVD